MGLRLLALTLLALLALPDPAFADAGAPMIAIVWPLALLLLVPIVLIEALVARRFFKLEFRRTFRLVLRANACSTLAGIPLAQALSFLLLVSGLLPQSPLSPAASFGGQVLSAVLTLFTMSVINPGRGPLAFPLAFAQIPAFFLSVLIEYLYLRRKLPADDESRVKQWAWRANELSYGLLILLLVIAGLW